MSRFFRRLYFLLHRRRLARELADEMEVDREIVGVVAYAVSQLTREIGIRMALGSHPWLVLCDCWWFPFPPAWPSASPARLPWQGTFVRCCLASAASTPTRYVFAIGLFPVAVLAAAVLPARQALGIDVVQALRRD